MAKVDVVLLLLVSALALVHASRRRYGNFGGVGVAGVDRSDILGGNALIHSGGPINFPHTHQRPHAGGSTRPIARPVHPTGNPTQPVGGGGGGFRPSSECSSRGCPVGPGEPTITFLDECYKLNTRGNVHEQYGSKVYHYSWCADGGKKYNWQAAQYYCNTTLEGGLWRPLSIEDSRENLFVTRVIETHRLPYIWTSGRRAPYVTAPFKWTAYSYPVDITYANWGRTGRQLRPQPDNNERPGGEQCLAILNYFYPGDSTTWHDINCRHPKPIICERDAPYGYTG